MGTNFFVCNVGLFLSYKTMLKQFFTSVQLTMLDYITLNIPPNGKCICLTDSPYYVMLIGNFLKDPDEFCECLFCFSFLWSEDLVMTLCLPKELSATKLYSSPYIYRI